MKCEQLYNKIYNKPAQFLSFCPYRISPLGAHIDHQLGLINGLTINKGSYIAYSSKDNGIIELRSVNFPEKQSQFHISSIPEKKQNDWADYCRGVAIMLNKKYALKNGLSGVIEGSLPIGGLSSSASITLVFLLALAKVNNIKLDPWEMIAMAKDAENAYVGVNCGKLDQSCEVLCKKDQLLYLDCLDNTYLLLPRKKINFSIALFFSGLERNLIYSDYNLRQDECKAAAYSILAYAGIPYCKFEDTVLRNVPQDAFLEYRNKLPENFRKRADHFFGEMKRIKDGIKAWKNEDIKTYGDLIFQSGESSIMNYECGCSELIKLFEIMTKTQGIYGGRFSGAGFKGYCIALIDPAYEIEILEKVKCEYVKNFPYLEDKYFGIICNSTDGINASMGV